MTTRIPTINPESAQGKAKDLLDSVKSKMGMIPNIAKALANSPAALNGYLSMSGALSQGSFSPQLREQIALTVAQANGCNYCLAAHSAVGKMVGLSVSQIADSRRGTAVDSKVDAVLRLARQVIDQRGWVTDDDLADARRTGLDDEAITEVVANVALNTFTNYFNHVAGTAVDFPPAEPLSEPDQSRN